MGARVACCVWTFLCSHFMLFNVLAMCSIYILRCHPGLAHQKCMRNEVILPSCHLQMLTPLTICWCTAKKP